MQMEYEYLRLLSDILNRGEDRGDRTGTGTRSLFGRQLRADIANEFPLLTTKKVPWKAMVGELLWFIEGSSDERRLAEITHGTRDGVTTIWTPNAMAPYWQPKAQFDGDLGRVYGVQWRQWQQTEIRHTGETVEHADGSVTHIDAKVHVSYKDQLASIIHTLKTNPTDRRMILSAYNVGELDQMALPPCHMFAQFYASVKGTLSCHLYMRSVDSFLGLPFNIASYALLTQMIAHVTGFKPGELIISTGDTHIYSNHIDQVQEQLSRAPMGSPTVTLNPAITSIDDFTMSDITLNNYQSHPAITAKMAV